ncbi:protein mono-ADP-ribosyltransferase PARP12-like isoform X2 [Sardina pilchardus]|uniref:protein mono-ADP-ribosyltransferase PARP12-like isoform X2 n=1 Tax=Sardina pilchardus TaxID=27697 RepID=UPI002E0D7223
MLQTSIQDKTQRRVRTSREPVKAPSDSKAPLVTLMSLPDYWNPDVLPPLGHAIIELDAASSEYSKVLNIFNRTMSGYDILSIKRIQNLALWKFFNEQADHMRKKNGGNANEQILFHGTDSNHSDAVCQENFDWQIHGTGTAYGQGSYFTRDASYSDAFTGPARIKSMFACRVLLGQYTKGQHNYVRTPAKEDNSSLLCDSCVDDVFNPSIFVVFEKHQVYPEYLIQYAWRRPNMYLPHPRLYRCLHPHPDMCLAPKPEHVPPPKPSHVPPPLSRHVPPPTSKYVPPPTSKYVPPPTSKHVPLPLSSHVPPPIPSHVPPPLSRHVPPLTPKHVHPSTPRYVPPPTARYVPPPLSRQMPPPLSKQVPPSTPRQVPPSTPKYVPPPLSRPVPPPTPRHGGGPSVTSHAVAQWSLSPGGSKNTTQPSSPKSQPQRVSHLIDYFHKLTNQQ